MKTERNFVSYWKSEILKLFILRMLKLVNKGWNESLSKMFRISLTSIKWSRNLYLFPQKSSAKISPRVLTSSGCDNEIFLQTKQLFDWCSAERQNHHKTQTKEHILNCLWVVQNFSIARKIENIMKLGCWLVFLHHTNHSPLFWLAYFDPHLGI